MRVAIGCTEEGVFIRQFDKAPVPDSFLAPESWVEDEIVEVSSSIVRAYIAFRAQEEAMQLLLGLILKDQHPES